MEDILLMVLQYALKLILVYMKYSEKNRTAQQSDARLLNGRPEGSFPFRKAAHLLRGQAWGQQGEAAQGLQKTGTPGNS